MSGVRQRLRLIQICHFAIIKKKRLVYQPWIRLIFTYCMTAISGQHKNDINFMSSAELKSVIFFGKHNNF